MLFSSEHILGEVASKEIACDFDGCRLCWAISDQAQRFPHNIRVCETADFVVLPAVGAIVPGYFLFVSKTHKDPLGTWTPSEAKIAEDQLKKAKKQLADVSKTWLVFEHGASRDCTARSCCIDHFHLHLVPANAEIFDRIVGRLTGDVRNVRGISNIPEAVSQSTQAYIALFHDDQNINLFMSSSFPSQFLRQALAAEISDASEWNWRAHSRDANAVETIRMLRDKKLLNPTVYFAQAMEGREPNQVSDNVFAFQQAISKYDVDVLNMAKIIPPILNVFSQRDERFLDKLLVQTELQFLRRCDALVVDLSIDGWQYVGSLMEVVHARLNNIPIVCIVGDSEISSRRWLRAHTDRIVPTKADAIEYLPFLLSLRSNNIAK